MRIKKFIFNRYFLGFLVGIVSLHLVKEMSLRRRRAPEPMVYVNDWSLTDQFGNSFGQRELRGKPSIINFFFTSCPTICPKLTQSMKEVYKRFSDAPDKINFAGITVDPDHDTPSVLLDYSKKYQIDKDNWRFLTGTSKGIYDVVVNKMKVYMGEREPINGGEGIYDIPHLAHIALFDARGNLRMLSNPNNAVELASLVRAAKFLMENPEK